MRNRFCDLFGIEIPIVQAPMGGATSPDMVAAVSNAGALGMLPVGWSDPHEIRTKIREIKARTDRPFGVNLVLAHSQEERLAICLSEGVRIISIFWAFAGELIDAAHSAGAKVFHASASAAEARAVVEAGADAVVALGWEAGGHDYSTVATMALVPAIVDAIGPVPVLAAGGIADGRGLAAAMMLGAAGAWIGTRFLASAEATIHPRYLQRVLAAKETDTVRGTLFDVGWPDAPHRTLRNKTIEIWEIAGRPPSGARPGEGRVVAQSPNGDILAYQPHTPGAEDKGDVEAAAMWAGQGVGLVRKVQPSADIVREIWQEARARIEQLALGGCQKECVSRFL